MIVKNEEAVLGRCLESISGIVDEIIVVDTGSSDGTKRIARKFTKNIYDFKWVDDFSKARNFSFSKATKEYILWLDADDVVSEGDRNKLVELKKTLAQDTDIVMMTYELGHNTHSSRERLLRRDRNYQWQDPVHEYIPLFGKIIKRPDIKITHSAEHKNVKSDRNLKIYQSILQRDSTLSPRSKFYYARELKDHAKYAEAILFFENFLEEGKGWREDNISACFDIAICSNRLSQFEKAHAALIRSFNYDAPRAEICCLLGYYYKNKSQFKAAATWFQIALNLPTNDEMGFVLRDYHGYIPAIELAVCYDAMQLYQKANQFNELAGKVKPDSAEYLQNKLYFSTKIKPLHNMD